MRAAQDAPRPNEIRDELGRIVASAIFRDSLRLTSFLRFVVEAALAGKSSQIKAYTIAIEALGRPTSFDPQTDAIVRVQAGRLRHALDRYYAGSGRDDHVGIALLRGGYVPVFRVRKAAGEANLPDHPVQSSHGNGAQSARHDRVRESGTPCGREMAILQLRVRELQGQIVTAHRTIRESYLTVQAARAQQNALTDRTEHSPPGRTPQDREGESDVEPSETRLPAR
ncbi:MAG: hypothetical protein ACLQBA_01305 [Candidatus Binataceae bacterium]